AGGDPVRPGDHPQRGALAAARGAEQDHELAVGDVEVEAVDGGDLAVPLSHPSEGHARHGAQPTRRTHRGETGAATGACTPPGGARSEERRVGKEGRSRWSPERGTKRDVVDIKGCPV